MKYDSFFNNLIMEFKFNKRVLKGYGIKVSAKAAQEASKIMPTTFNLDYDSVTKSCFDEVVNDYMISLGKDYVKKEPFSIISIALTLNFPKLSRPALIIVGYIASKIQFDSNYIELKEKDFAGYSGLCNKSFFDGIKELVDIKVLAITNRKCMYVVNHNMIFKGNLEKFIATYNELYGKPCVVDEQGRIVINK